MDPLVIHAKPLPSQQRMQSPLAELETTSLPARRSETAKHA
jgi:hypothetical protein